MVKALVTEDGTIAIPQVILNKFGLGPGTALLFDEEAPSLQVTKEVDLTRMRLALGCAKDGLPGYTSQTWLDETRGRAKD